MADTTHDITDDGFHEIHLSGKQLVFLFMATTVVSVVIFLCGVLVGRGVQAQQPPDPLTEPTGVAMSPGSSLPLSDTGPQADEPPAPPAEGDELSYKRRLEGDSARESLQPEPRPGSTSAPQSPRQGAPRASDDTVPEPADPPPARTTARAATPPPANAPAAAPPATDPGAWVVQVHALRDRNTANTIVKRLVAKGYPAFLAAGGPASGAYRVQIGRFKDRSEAERTVNRLKKEEKFDPWITR